MGNSILVDPHGRNEDERKSLRAKIEEVNKYAFENWNNPQWRHEMAQDLTETIYRGFEYENLLSLFVNVENAGFNDRVLVKEVRGLRAFWVARGGYIDASTLNAQVMEIPRDTIGFHVYEFADKIMTNFGETQATLVELGTKRLDAEVSRRVLTTFQAAIPVSDSSYVATSGVSLAVLNAAIRQVRDVSRDQQVTIIGRATMTEQILDSLLGATTNGSGFLPQTNEALVSRGVIGNYRGANIITLVNWLDDTDAAFFPANELYVIGKDASKAAFFGGLMSKEWEDNDWYWHYKVRRDFGITVHRPDRVRRIVDSNITP